MACAEVGHPLSDDTHLVQLFDPATEHIPLARVANPYSPTGGGNYMQVQRASRSTTTSPCSLPIIPTHHALSSLPTDPACHSPYHSLLSLRT